MLLTRISSKAWYRGHFHRRRKEIRIKIGKVHQKLLLEWRKNNESRNCCVLRGGGTRGSFEVAGTKSPWRCGCG